MKQNTPKSSQHVRFFGALVITFVLCGIAVVSQLKTGQVDQSLLGALVLVFMGWLGENIADLILTFFGRSK